MTSTTEEAKNLDIKTLSFEAAITELEELTRRLETGAASLEDSITLYERGALLKAHCEEKLKAAQLRVDQIVETAGAISIEPFAQS